jgi:hypothetical protein
MKTALEVNKKNLGKYVEELNEVFIIGDGKMKGREI